MLAASYYNNGRFPSFVPNEKYEANVDPATGFSTFEIPAALTASATALTNGAALTTGVAKTYTYGATEGIIAEKYGRSLSFDADGATTRTFTVSGLDFMGQPITETGSLNGTTAVETVKCYKKVNKVVIGASADTAAVTIGTGSRLGLPFKAIKMITELVDGAIPTGGALTAGVDTQTATSSDPRGYYVPHASAVPNGSRVYTLTIQGDLSKIRGAAHYVV